MLVKFTLFAQQQAEITILAGIGTGCPIANGTKFQLLKFSQNFGNDFEIFKK